MKLLILMSAFAVVYGRPKALGENENKSTVQIEKLQVVEIKPEIKSPQNIANAKEVDKVTQEILEKIKQVNKNHGYSTKSIKPTNKQFDIPHYYVYSHQQPKPTGKQFDSLQFSNDQYFHPVLNNYVPIFIENLKSGYQTNTNKEADIIPEDLLPGQYIKRKITHHQTYIMPNLNPVETINEQLPFSDPYLTYNPNWRYIDKIPDYQNFMPIFQRPSLQFNNRILQQTLEDNSIQNIKNILVDMQLPYNMQTPPNFNPLVQNLPHYNPYTNYFLPEVYAPNTANMQWYHPNKQIQSTDGARVMINTLTTMVEYGVKNDENCNGRACAKGDYAEMNLIQNIPKPNKNEIKDREQRYAVDSIEKSIEFELYDYNDKQNNSVGNILNLASISIPNDNNNILISNLNSRNEKGVPNKPKRISNPLQLIFQPPKMSPPVRDQQLSPEEKDSVEIEDLSSDGIKKDLLHDSNNKKILSKDNTGSGIFIHKLKVRKGGVAIAGPGGIATAGSGGTAIVGPNGFAYTHPDSLAIAGSGSKVIAVDPSINLSDIVKNNIRSDGSTPRVGKVVAIGPVVYYNRG